MPRKRKKSKYKYAVIGKKKYYFYKIVWVDPCGDAGHADVDEMKKLYPSILSPSKSITIPFLSDNARS